MKTATRLALCATSDNQLLPTLAAPRASEQKPPMPRSTGRDAGVGSAVVVDDFDVVPVGVQDERGVVARVVDGALAGTAVVLIALGERGGVERPDGRVVLRRERDVDVLRERPLVADQREA
jgi:hypothetical protein